MNIFNSFKKKAVLQSSGDKKVKTSRATHVSLSFLKQFIPISEHLSESEFNSLSIEEVVFAPGQAVFRQSTTGQALLYLVSGIVRIEIDNGYFQEVDADTFRAKYPLSTENSQTLNIIATTTATVIYLPAYLLESQVPVWSQLKVLPLPEILRDNEFCKRFYQHFKRDELIISQLPEVVLKLRKVIQQQDVVIADIVKVINSDPSIAARLIQIANNPLYRTANPITTCSDAVSRLGLYSTANLVTAFSLKKMIICKSSVIKKLMQNHWLQSVKVSSISYALAGNVSKIDREEALLAGLLHNIGGLPILMFADGEPDDSYQIDDLLLCLRHLQAIVGCFILESWALPESFRPIPINCSRWFRDHDAVLDLSDIVILAKYHHDLSINGGANLPLITTLPAFNKLNNQLLTPEFSLSVLQDAKQQIAETIKFFTT